MYYKPVLFGAAVLAFWGLVFWYMRRKPETTAPKLQSVPATLGAPTPPPIDTSAAKADLIATSVVQQSAGYMVPAPRLTSTN